MEEGVNELALFAGAGGGILGGKLLGWNTIGAVEIEEYPRAVLLQRQRDGILSFFPIWDDIRTFDGRPWSGAVDIITGGFPCTDISAAGKGAGIQGKKSGLWGEMHRIIYEVKPRFAFMENSPLLTSRGLDRVLSDLSEIGYNARWDIIGAHHLGAPHKRDRIWILAYTDGKRGIQSEEAGRSARGRTRDEGKTVANSDSIGTKRGQSENREGAGVKQDSKISWWDTDPADLPHTQEIGLQGWLEDRHEVGEEAMQYVSSEHYKQKGTENRSIESGVGRLAHGVARRVDRLKAIGNGQVPAVAALAFTILSEGLI